MLKVNQNQDKLDIPSRRGHTSVILNDHRIFVFGGILGFNKYTNDTIVFDIEVLIYFYLIIKNTNQLRGLLLVIYLLKELSIHQL